MRYLAFYFFLVSVISFDTIASDKCWKLSEIPVIYNIDSLEESIKHLDKESEVYLFNLIAIEWSRLQIRAGQYGKYNAAIVDLSDKHNQPMGSAFVDYITASSNLKPGYAVNHYTLNAAENSMAKFKANDDVYGVFFCNTLISRLYTFRIYREPTEDATQDSIETSKELLRIKEHNKIADSISKKINDPFLRIYYSLHKAKTLISTFPKEGDIEEAKMICTQILNYLSVQKSNSHYKSLAYFFYTNALVGQDSLEKALYFEKLGLMSLLPSQISMKFGSLVSIANHTNSLGQIDSSIRYCRLAIDFIQSHKIDGDFDLLNLYENAVNNFEEKKMLDSALHYAEKLKFATNDYFQRLYKNEQENFSYDIKFAIDKQKIEEQNNLNKKIVLVSFVFLAVLLISIIVIFRSQRKLNQAYLKIKELQHAREKFYSIVAHDLRSPMVSYQNLAATLNRLIKKNDFVQIEKISRKIDENGIKLNNMLENLFKWSLAEQSILSYSAKVCEFEPIVRDILLLYRQISAERDILFEEQIEYNGSVFVDPNYLQTVVRNLLDNAIKNSSSIVRFCVRKEDTDLCIEVMNSGTMDVEKSIIISRFLSSDREYQPGENGIGMGLILARDFSKAMNARIEFIWSLEGITFRLKLPLI